jgi:Co/Zn/Cd efflux system component
VATDRIHALTIVLDKDYRDDDVQPIVNAIRQIRGVADVTEQHVTTIDDHSARHHVRMKLGSTLFDVFHAVLEGREVTIEPRG